MNDDRPIAAASRIPDGEGRHVLIPDGAGYVGNVVARMLLARNWKVRVLWVLSACMLIGPVGRVVERSRSSWA
ncbi:MAG: hypothetical protein ACR2NA_09735 [Solirubrobacterales bacterium]